MSQRSREVTSDFQAKERIVRTSSRIFSMHRESQGRTAGGTSEVSFLSSRRSRSLSHFTRSSPFSSSQCRSSHSLALAMPAASVRNREGITSGGGRWGDCCWGQGGEEGSSNRALAKTFSGQAKFTSDSAARPGMTFGELPRPGGGAAQ
eukprot:730785-Hanusia_phi.AAC.1